MLKEVSFLKILFFLIILSLGIFLFYALQDGRFFLAHEDETIYYKSAQLLYETNSLKDASCINEDVSKILQTSWYGPFYHIFYGGIAKIVGFNNYYFVIVHFLLILFSLVIFSSLNISTEKRLLLFVAFLAAPGALSYIFTYFPESLHLFFSAVLTFVLTKIYQQPEVRKYVAMFVMLVLFFVLFRVTSVFWLIGILPFAKSRREVAHSLGIVFGGVLFSLLYMKFFTAPAYFSSLKSFDYLFEGRIFDFIKPVIDNLLLNVHRLFSEASFSNCFLGVLCVVSVIRLFLRWDKILFSAVLIATLSFLVLMLLYTATAFNFEKQTAFLFPLLIVANIMTLEEINKLWIALFISALPFSMVCTYENISARKMMSVEYVKREEMVRQFSEIADWVKPDSASIIQWFYPESYFPNRLTEAILPCSNKKGYPILYTTNICPLASSDYEKFRRWGKLKIDYVLSKHKLSLSGLELLRKTNYFYFYKIVG